MRHAAKFKPTAPQRRYETKTNGLNQRFPKSPTVKVTKPIRSGPKVWASQPTFLTSASACFFLVPGSGGLSSVSISLHAIVTV
jgi:hypothetical protein